MSQFNKANDTNDLEQFGYKQELNRSMQKFSSFAISFSLISILTGIFANFQFGYENISSKIIYSWLLVFFGQLLVASIMSDLSIKFPLSGYGYQWSSRLVNKNFGFATGWLLLTQFITGFPGICKAMAILIEELINQYLEFNISNNLISIFLIWIIIYFHYLGIKIISKINNVGVIMELIGVIILIGLLVFFIYKIDFSEINFSKDFSFTGISFNSFALSILLGAWCLTGFEAASDMSEETIDPKRTVPKSIFSSLIYSGIFGMILILLFSIYMLSEDFSYLTGDNILYKLMNGVFGKEIFAVILFFILSAIFACGVACVASSSRLIFSMSRDRILPKSNWLRYINRKGAPSNTLFIIGFLSTVFILLFDEIEVITGVSAIAGYLGYCGIIVSSFYKKETDLNISAFLKRNFKIVKVIAICWCFFVVFCLLTPLKNDQNSFINIIPAVSTISFIFIGFLVYLLNKK